MLLHEMTLGIIFFSQAGVGVLENFFLSCYISTLFTSHRPRPMDTILTQLSLANAILLLSHGMPTAILYFRKQYFVGNAGCKIVFFLRRLSRGLSMNYTCLLSVFQAVIISLSSSKLAKIKGKIPKVIQSYCLFCWMLNILIEMNGTACITGSRNSNNSHKGEVDLLYCYWENVFADLVIPSSLRDVLLVGCMVCTSSYMVLLLHRHHQRLQYINSTNLSLKMSPDIRATHSILRLVGAFIFTYCVSSSFVLYEGYFIQTHFWLMNVATLITLCFPTICPFLLIHRETEISRSYCTSQ